MKRKGFDIWTVLALCISSIAWGGTEGSISGTISDSQGVAISGAPVELRASNGKTIKKTTATATGEYQFFPVTIGDYTVFVEVTGFEPASEGVHVASAANSQADVQLQPASAGKEMVLKVEARRRNLVQNTTSTSQTEISHEQIAALPGGETVSLPDLITSTSPGVVPGSFGQMFFRGNHANVQYQIDGVQLPDSPSNTFGETFSPRNIDHMEIITGGTPAEYGERLSAVVNIVTKSGAEKPGGSLEVNYGSYNMTSPQVMYGGSNESGTLHYFLSANYHRTDRGLDTPQPESETNQSQGTRDAVHDGNNGNNEFAKLDWYLGNQDKLSLILFNAYDFYQIPNYPSSFSVNSPFFSQLGFVDQFGNTNGPGATTFNYTPSLTNNTQAQTNSYAQTVWKHTFSDRMFLQLAPYYKYSHVKVGNDLLNDLYTASDGQNPVTGASPSSFAENRSTNNYGLKGDLSIRPDDRNYVKTGFQVQGSRSTGFVSIQQTVAGPASIDSSPSNSFFESVYLQDDFTVIKPLTLNVGIRFDASQNGFSDVSTYHSAVQPRVGLTWMINDLTKWHVFYGRLFQPAPAENLRVTFGNVNSVNPNQLTPYDIKPEIDNYYEAGIARQLPGEQVLSLTGYYKDATNMLDDAELGNSSVFQPFNFAHGYAFGFEASLSGKIDRNWSNFVNYSFGKAKAQGISGGLFAFPPDQLPSDVYQYLDHVQISTLNSGLTYSSDLYWGTVEAQYGSGLRTGPDNTNSLPGHFTMDLSGGYKFKSKDWLARWTVSADLLNIFNNLYPITVANGFNGSHYAAGREYILHLTKEL